MERLVGSHLEAARGLPEQYSQHGVTKTILHLQVFGSSVDENQFGMQLAKLSGWTVRSVLSASRLD